MRETEGDPDHPRPGLRERKKLFTRRTIADSAFELVVEQGFDNVTIDQIADRAFVSPRTVSNYFPSKEAAVLAAHDDAPLSLLADWSDRPTDEPPLVSLRATLTTTLRSWTKQQLQSARKKQGLVASNPALLPHRTAQWEELEQEIARGVAERTGVDSLSDPLPHLIAGTATAVVKAAFSVWENTGGGADSIADLVDRGFAELEAGLATSE